MQRNEVVLDDHDNPTEYAGIERLRVTESGALEVEYPGGAFSDGAPEAYQVADGERRTVAVRYRLSAGMGSAGRADASCEYGFRERGLDEIVAVTSPNNMRSRRVMEKLGMTHDPAENFEHPSVPEGSPLREHVLYRLPRIQSTR